MTSSTGETEPTEPTEAAPTIADEARDADRLQGRRLEGTVRRVTFHHPDTGYTVVRIRPARGFADPEASSAVLLTELTAVGRGSEPAVGSRVELGGTWQTHPSHGRQFAYDWLRVLPPLDARGLVRYLSSKSFAGIGETLAQRIVDELGTRCLEIIRDEPERLERIPGLRKKVREQLVRRVVEELSVHRVRAFLAGLGLGAAHVHTVAEKLGVETEERVRSDPFVLADVVPGIGFRTADQVAEELGLAPDSFERRRAAVRQSLRDARSEGHSLLPSQELFRRASELLRQPNDEEAWNEVLERMRLAEELVVEEAEAAPAEGDVAVQSSVYLPALHHCEVGLAEQIDALLGTAPRAPYADSEVLAAIERRVGLELHRSQREAVVGLSNHGLSLLTGGPGVGKTTIVRLVVELAERAGAKVKLASPTGRAAKRLAEATGRPASTIHRLLGWDAERSGFAHHPSRPLEADLVVVDEISMLDLVLAYHLLRAVHPPTRLVLVGDPDQLPSVGAGNVLADLLSSGRVPTWRLTHIFRQQLGSRIVTNAHRILAGELPELPGRDESLSDFYYFPAEDDTLAAERLVDVVTQRIPERFGLDWEESVQVLAPMYRGACGVDALNERLRAHLSVKGREVEYRGRVWRVGDRVIHTRNDYEKQVFNGDLGRVTRVHSDGGLLVRYPEQDVFYEPREFADLQPAFAMTVHRSQGGEFPAVVIPLVPQHHVMLQRHLLYTAVTRARRLCVLVGSQRALRRAVENAEQGRRMSGLAERLRS